MRSVITFLREPAFCVLVSLPLILSTVVAITSGSAIESAVLRAPPFEEPEYLFAVSGVRIVRSASGASISSEYEDPTLFEALGMFAAGTAVAGDSAFTAPVAVTDEGFWRALRVETVQGRLFVDALDRSAAVAIVSAGLRPRPEVGSVLRINGTAFTVVGIVPDEMRFPDGARIWVPIGNEALVVDGVFSPEVVGRIARSNRAERVQSLLYAMAGLPEKADSPTLLRPLVTRIRGEQPNVLIAVASLGALVFGAAVLAVNGIWLARWASLRDAFAVRWMLGASPLRLLGHILARPVILAFTSVGVGLGLAFLSQRTGGVPWLPSSSATPPRGDLIRWTVVVGLVAVSASSAPAIATWLSIIHTKKRIRRHFGYAHRLLLITQIALGVLLLCVTVSAHRRLDEILGVDLGFRRAEASMARLNLASPLYASSAERAGAIARLEEQAEGAAVQALGVMTQSIGHTGVIKSLALSARQGTAKKDRLVVREVGVTSGFFEALGIDRLAGRGFDRLDAIKSEPVTILSLTTARAISSEPFSLVGRQVFSATQAYRVVGVVQDAKIEGPFSAFSTVAYFPMSQVFVPSVITLVVLDHRGSSADQLRAIVKAVDVDLPVRDQVRVGDLLSRFAGRELSVFATAASWATAVIAMCWWGLHGVLAEYIASRRIEIAIRYALGMTPLGVALMVLRRAARLTLLGAAIGFVLVVVVLNGLAALTSELPRLDLLTVLLAAVGMLASSLFTAVLPALVAVRSLTYSTLRPL